MKSSKKILIVGKGFLGQRLQKELGCCISDKRINCFKDGQSLIKRYKPKIIINCIGSTGKRNVDDCEIDKDKTLFANSYVPLILAEVALRNRIKLIHISSGCIYRFNYFKDKPITEDSTAYSFDLFYSRTKIYAERALEALAKKYDILITRIRIPLDNRPHPKNILTKIMKFKRVIDLPNSITYIPDFIKALKHLIKINAKGVYNVVNDGRARYPDLLEVYKEHTGAHPYKVIKQKDLKLVRTNLLLSTKKLKKTGFKVRNIKEVYEECVREYLKY